MDTRKLASVSAIVTAALVSMADHPPPHQEGWHLTNSAEGPAITLDAAAPSVSKRINVRANGASLRAEEIADLYATVEALVTGCIPDPQAAQLSAPARVRVTVNPDQAEHDPFEADVPLCADGSNFVTWPATNAPLAGCTAGADCVFSFDVTFERLDADLVVPVDLAWNVVGGVNGPLESAPMGGEILVDVVDLP